MKRHVLIALGLVSVLLGLVFLSPFSSVLPDGLEKVAADLGLGPDDRDAVWQVAPAPGYVVAGVGKRSAATRLAALAGTALVFALAVALACALRKRGPRGQSRDGADKRALP